MEEFELIAENEYRTVERLPVPGGWLYITETKHDPVVVASTFVPRPKGAKAISG